MPKKYHKFTFQTKIYIYSFFLFLKNLSKRKDKFLNEEEKGTRKRECVRRINRAAIDEILLYR